MRFQEENHLSFPQSSVLNYTLLGFFIIFLSLLPLFISPLWIRIATEVLMWAGLAQSWNIIGGYTGYLCFGHGAFFGVGAYFTGILMIYLNMPFGLCLFISGIMASFLAFLIGYPTLRLRGAYFAIATWAFGEMVRQIAIILNITGGAFGMQLPPYLNLPFFYYIMLLVAGITYLSTYTLLERAKFGYKLLAIREHEEAAEMVGVDTTMIKIKAFVLSAFSPGVMGGIYAYWVTYIHPDSVLKADITDFMVVMAFLGGIGSLWGPFLGAVVVQLIQRILWIFWGEGTFYLVIIGLSICAVVLFIPNGLIGLLEGKVSSPKESITFLLKKLKW